MIPKNPATLKANGILVDEYLVNYFRKYYPAWAYRVTSGYRTPEINKNVGGAQDSAHMYNLARDFIFLDLEGKEIKENKARMLYNQFFTEWPGYHYFSPATSEKGYHIHANLPREWSKKTFWVGAFVAIGAGLIMLNKIANSPQFNKIISNFKKR